MPEARIDQLLAAARARIERVRPEALVAEQAAGALVIDIRPEANRRDEGEVPGALVVELVHFMWRLDPTSPDRLPEVTPDSRVIVMCNEGYASSLAAAQLQELGLERSADLEGGARAWFRHIADEDLADPGET
ncbi:MAG TPA: rhodanese-like domain-containing protein [Acidimicrobiales bacterium]